MEQSRIYNIAQVETNCHTSVSNGVETLVKKPLYISKKVDKEQACVGDILTYTVSIRNSSLVDETQVLFSDKFEGHVIYVNESFLVNGQSQIPAIEDHTLYYMIPLIEAMSTVDIVFQVRITG